MRQSEHFRSFFFLMLYNQMGITRMLMTGLAVSILMLVDQYVLILLVRIYGSYVVLALHGSTSLMGVFFMRNYAVFRIHCLEESIRKGDVDYTEFPRVILSFLSAIFFIMPGIPSMMLGLLIVSPPCRIFFSLLLRRRYARAIGELAEHLRLQVFTTPPQS